MIVANNPYFGGKIAEIAQSHYNPASDSNIVRVEDDVLLGGSIFQNYTGPGGSIGMHVASFAPRWINPDLLWATFHYPFVQLGVRKIFGQVPVNNLRALTFDLKLGFTIEAKLKDVYPDGDMILVSMYRENCRHLRIKPRSIAVKEAA